MDKGQMALEEHIQAGTGILAQEVTARAVLAAQMEDLSKAVVMGAAAHLAAGAAQFA